MVLVEEPLLPELDGLLEAPLALDGLELDGLLLELLLPAPELMLPEPEDEEPEEPLWPACHSERDSLPSWSLSSLSNSLDEPDEDDEVPPEAELGLELDELGVELDDELSPEDDLLLCAMGEEEEPELLFASPAA